MFAQALPVAVFAFLLLVTNGAAQSTQKACTFSNNWCTPFIGCFAAKDTFFIGFTLGRRSGPLFATTTEGATCSGTWKRGMFGGRAKFTCDDGVTGKATYRHLDKRSGTAVGKGRTNTGKRIDLWSGQKLMRYFASNEMVREGMIACGETLLNPQLAKPVMPGN